MTGGPVWIDGSLEGRVDPLDRGLTLGDGVFDTLVVFRGIPFEGARHLDRLAGHAAAIGIELNPARVREGWEAVLGEAASEHSILRTTVTRGVTGRGLWPPAFPQPTVIVSASPWSREAVARPVRLVTSAIRRNATSPTSRLKTTNYLDNILAAREAAERGADDALLLNEHGHPACTTIANIFALSGATLSTPPAADGAMAGIMRGLVMEAAAEAGFQAVEKSLGAADLAGADQLFVTNSVRLVAPVSSLDGLPAGGMAPVGASPLLGLIAARIESECGFNPLESG